ncbi:MAG: hypothetical protein IMZ57_11170 [Acidobacteria bacterium]|nr:hypothetical protein [Acidobacteriota bacterium]
MATKALGLIPVKNRVKLIETAYGRAGDRLVGILSELNPATFTAAIGGRARGRVNAIVRDLDAFAGKWARAAVREAYAEGSTFARTRLENIGAEKKPPAKFNPGRHERAIAALVSRTAGDLLKANRTIATSAGKYLSLLSLAAAEVRKVEAFEEVEVEAFADATLGKGIKRIVKRSIGGGPDAVSSLARGTISRMIKSYLLKKIAGADFITIKDRHYSLKSYSEMLARTGLREAQTKATKELCDQYDNDLVQFSQHDEPCGDCEQYEGEVFSISGKSDKYPELPPEAEPPVHPNCEHNLNPTSENALSWRSR